MTYKITGKFGGKTFISPKSWMTPTGAKNVLARVGTRKRAGDLHYSKYTKLRVVKIR